MLSFTQTRYTFSPFWKGYCGQRPSLISRLEQWDEPWVDVWDRSEFPEGQKSVCPGNGDELFPLSDTEREWVLTVVPLSSDGGVCIYVIGPCDVVGGSVPALCEPRNGWDLTVFYPFSKADGREVMFQICDRGAGSLFHVFAHL